MSTWENIVGHNWAVELLQSAIRNDRIGHAYLFTGPDQIGKTTLSLTFAQALNCTNESIGRRPCGQCRSCTLTNGERHPDVRMVSGEISSRGNMSLKIERVRKLQQELNLTAAEARYKIAILRRFESATHGAVNAFLKTLEEPPKNVILLLTASSTDALLPTIVSRCRTINLRPIIAPEIERALVNNWQVDQDQAKLLAHLADGRLGWAVRASQDSEIPKQRLIHIDSLYDVFRMNRVDRFTLAQSLANRPEYLPILFQTWLSWWRDMALLAHGVLHGSTIINIDQVSVMNELENLWTSLDITRCLRLTEHALQHLESNVNIRLATENLLLAYPFTPVD